MWVCWGAGSGDGGWVWAWVGGRGLTLEHKPRPDLCVFSALSRGVGAVAARFVTTARFITNEVVTNRAGIAPFFSHLDISVHVILCVSLVCVCV